jgi:hypothetical protein
VMIGCGATATAAGAGAGAANATGKTRARNESELYIVKAGSIAESRGGVQIVGPRLAGSHRSQFGYRRSVGLQKKTRMYLTKEIEDEKVLRIGSSRAIMFSSRVSLLFSNLAALFQGRSNKLNLGSRHSAWLVVRLQSETPASQQINLFFTSCSEPEQAGMILAAIILARTLTLVGRRYKQESRLVTAPDRQNPSFGLGTNITATRRSTRLRSSDDAFECQEMEWNGSFDC